MVRRLHQTMADYVVIAISPALIMTLVGSLVFFLLAVLYQGQFALRLHWVMACFVFAAVLIGRISIQEGFERAAPFGIALATVVGIAATKFMDVQGTWIDSFSWAINWGLIALIWWCAHRLTWDCTLIDDEQDASGEGLLQTAGLETPAEKSNEKAEDKLLEGTTSRQVPSGWWQRYVQRQRQPHAPGVWVVYFSLAALPLFGIGQWFIPADNVTGRRYAFWLLTVYVASGLGLLLTTSFLGLRRYLRQRRIEMPTLMANLWLGIGATVIAMLLLLAALLPRPSAEYAISQLPFSVGSPEQHASRSPPVAREGTRDQQPGSAPERQPRDENQENKPADQKNNADTDRATSSQGQSSPQPSPGAPEPQGQASQSDDPSSKPSDRQDASRRSNGDKGRGESADKGKQSSDEGKSSASREPPARSEANQRARSPRNASDPAKALEKLKQKPGQQEPSEQPPPPKQARQPEQREQEQKPERAQQPQQPQQPDSSTEVPRVPQAVEVAASGLAELFKWVFYGVVAVAVLFLLWRSRAELLSMLREFLAALRELWSGVFGRKRVRKTAANAAAPIEFPPMPFSSYADPFATGIAARYSIEELVRYSFEAFEAWAREHGCTRQPDQTPHELARDVTNLNGYIAAEARNLVELYARAAYARGELPPTSNDQLRQLWARMRSSTTASI